MRELNRCGETEERYRLLSRTFDSSKPSSGAGLFLPRTDFLVSTSLASLFSTTERGKKLTKNKAFSEGKSGEALVGLCVFVVIMWIMLGLCVLTVSTIRGTVCHH